MPVFHYLHFRAFAHETDDPEKVRRALRHAIHDDRVALEESFAEGQNGNRILILDADAKSAQSERALFASLRQDDPEAGARLVEELPRRLDENGNFHVRLDKQEASLGRVRLATGDDAILVRGKLRVFRQVEGSREAALEALHRLLVPPIR